MDLEVLKLIIVGILLFAIGLLIGSYSDTNIISNLLGVFGIIISAIGFYFTYISFVNPIGRARSLIKDWKNWEKISFANDYSFYIYRHKKYSNYQIEINKDNPINSEYRESWIPELADSDCKSFSVKIKSSGVVLIEEVFISLDGGRYFIPCPRRESREGRLIYYYDSLQVQLASIIGEYWDMDKNLNDFLKSNNVSVEVRK